MINAIGSSPVPGPAGTGTATAGLEAQLGRYQKELSNWISCDSANTRQGREAIQAVSNKIAEVKARIEAITLAKSITQPATQNWKIPDGIAALKDALAPGAPASDAIAPVALVSDAPDNSAASAVPGYGPEKSFVGSRLDVFA